MKRGAVLAKLAHRAEHRDAPRDVPLFAEALERRRHRRRIGVVALVDQQHFAAVDRDHVALAAALEPAEVGKRETGDRHICADRLDRGEHRERVGHPMLAALRNGEGQLALEQGRADQASAALRT